MSTTSSIEWTDVTWNPVRGCSLVSEGCRNCYAMKQAHRFSGAGKAYEGLTELGPTGPRWTGKIRLVPDALEEPLHWRKPRRVFVNSMSDLFHEDLPDDFIDQVFTTILRTPQHTYQILTKRPDRMKDYIRGRGQMFVLAQGPTRSFDRSDRANWPPINAWLGVSVENQATADERIPSLLQTPAAIRFLSVEPLLAAVDLKAASAFACHAHHTQCGPWCDGKPGIHWVIVGGESGSGARPMELAWARSIVEQCRAAGVACFVKQLGARPIDDGEHIDQRKGVLTNRLPLSNRKGGDMAEWPPDLRVRQFPEVRA